eukprot:scaffold40314_cov206-Amphora_coffeaeformis.AAC.4
MSRGHVWRAVLPPSRHEVPGAPIDLGNQPPTPNFLTEWKTPNRSIVLCRLLLDGKCLRNGRHGERCPLRERPSGGNQIANVVLSYCIEGEWNTGGRRQILAPLEFGNRGLLPCIPASLLLHLQAFAHLRVQFRCIRTASCGSTRDEQQMCSRVAHKRRYVFTANGGRVAPKPRCVFTTYPKRRNPLPKVALKHSAKRT